MSSEHSMISVFVVLMQLLYQIRSGLSSVFCQKVPYQPIPQSVLHLEMQHLGS